MTAPSDVPRPGASRLLPVAVALALVGTLVAFLLWPLADSVRGAFVDANGRFTLDYLVTVFRNPLYREGMRNAFGIAFFSTLVAATIGIAAAALLDRFEFPGRRLFAALVPLPLMVPPFVGAVGVR
jgi:iron(III) transport system permease protein